jgi:hypothetical protein
MESSVPRILVHVLASAQEYEFSEQSSPGYRDNGEKLVRSSTGVDVRSGLTSVGMRAMRRWTETRLD